MGTLRWLLAALLGCTAPQALSAQTAPPCDVGLRPLAKSPFAYGLRGDRCEGLYGKQVGGTVLTVVSFTSAFERYDLTQRKNLRMEWATPADSVLRIRVRSIRPGLYYGMDAVRSEGETSYEWPISMLASLNIRQPDLGTLAWTRRKVGSVTRNVYIPLRIVQTELPPGPGYTLVVFPGVKLQEVYVTLGTADSAGRPIAGRLLKQNEPLGQRFYPAERPIRIRIPPLEPAGLYSLEVTTILPDGSPEGLAPLLFEIGSRGESR